MKRINMGILTIGQSPRVDMTPEIMPLIPAHVDVIEMGALDGLSDAELKLLEPGDEDVVLVTRLNSGASVRLAEHKIIGKLQEKIKLLGDRGCQTTILACTGSFPAFESNHPLLFPDRVLNHVIQAILPKGKLGVILPLAEQIEDMRAKWKAAERIVEFAAASPYQVDNGIEEAAVQLQAKGVDCIVLDCIGYNQAMKEKVREATGLPVVLPRSTVARVAAELLS